MAADRGNSVAKLTRRAHAHTHVRKVEGKVLTSLLPRKVAASCLPPRPRSIPLKKKPEDPPLQSHLEDRLDCHNRNRPHELCCCSVTPLNFPLQALRRVLPPSSFSALYPLPDGGSLQWMAIPLLIRSLTPSAWLSLCRTVSASSQLWVSIAVVLLTIGTDPDFSQPSGDGA